MILDTRLTAANCFSIQASLLKEEMYIVPRYFGRDESHIDTKLEKSSIKICYDKMVQIWLKLLLMENSYTYTECVFHHLYQSQMWYDLCDSLQGWLSIKPFNTLH